MRNSALCWLLASLLVMLFLSKEAFSDSSLLIFFDFDEEGEIAKDLSEHGNDGTLEGDPKWVEGKRGKALLFDGKGTVVSVPADRTLDLEGEHTISFWLQWNGSGSSWSPIIAKRAVGAINPDNYSTWVGSDKKWDYRNDTGIVSAGTTIDLGNDWVFLTVTHDGGNKVSFYIDGELDDTANVSPAGANDGTFVMGSGKHPAGDYGAGAIDDFALFNRDLSEVEIVELMDVGAKAFTAVESAGKLATIWGSVKESF